MEETENAGYEGGVGEVCEVGGECEYGGYDGFVLREVTREERDHSLYSTKVVIHCSIDMYMTSSSITYHRVSHQSCFLKLSEDTWLVF